MRIPSALLKQSLPVLGFGTSALMGGGRRNAAKLLQAAFDSGIRHFDTARYYGFGEAEEALGDFLKEKRNQVTITTKFGLEPPGRTSGLKMAVGLGRRLANLFPGLRKTLSRHAPTIAKEGAFSVADAQRNLETSLRLLCTSWIDFYLLHEYSVNEKEPPNALLAFLESAVQSGKIRAIGIGTSIENVVNVLKWSPGFAQVVQIQSSALNRDIAKLPLDTNRLVITHGSLSKSYQILSDQLARDLALRGRLSEALGGDIMAEGRLAGCLLNDSLRDNPTGAVLFSSKDPVRIRQNASCVFDPSRRPSAKALEQFRTLTSAYSIP